MGKYKTGDKIVLNILSEDKDGYYIIGNSNQRWWFLSSKLDDENVSKPLTDYICDIEQARTEGQEEAWKLALKLKYMDYEDKVECFDLEYDGKEKWIEIMEKYTYTEAAAKVADWKKAKEEICVGDVVSINNVNQNGVVICDDFNVVSVITPNGSVIIREKNKCTKTGRHIDVDAWLAQIGGESE